MGKNPTRRVVRTTEYTEPEEERENGLDRSGGLVADFDAAEETFSQFRNKFGHEGVIVKVYRRTPRGAFYCFSATPGEIDEEVVRLYHCKQACAGEEGQYFAKAFVRGEPRDAFPILVAPQIATPGANESHGGMAAQGDVVRLLEGHIERLEARLMAMQSVEREPLSSMADALVKLQSLSPKSELPLDTLIKAIELGKSISGGGAPAGDDWMGLLKEGVREFGPVVRGLVASRLGGAGAPGAPGGAAGGGAMGQAALSDADEGAMLREAIQFLKRKCVALRDPGLYIDLIVDNRDQVVYERLLQRVRVSEFSEFAAIDPEIAHPPYYAFFKYVYDGLRSAIAALDKVATDSVREGGDAGDAPGDAEPNAGGGGES